MTDILERRLRELYHAWNNPTSPELPEGAELLLTAADKLPAEFATMTERSPKHFQFGTWYPIESAPLGKKVLVSVSNGRNRPPITLMAIYYKRFQLEAPDGYGASDGFDEDEHGEVFCPPAWYEYMAAEEPPLHNIDPTHWMPLPPHPEEQIGDRSHEPASSAVSMKQSSTEDSNA